MDLKQLESFAAIVETGSFSRAGELLHLTQPTVSTHISALEREFRVKLFSRTARENAPTEAGRLLYRYAREMLDTRERAAAALGGLAQEMHGVIAVAASTIPCQYFLPRVIQRFREQYPEIRFTVEQMDSGEVIRAVSARSVEIGLSGTTQDGGKCLFRPFAEDRLVLVTPNTPHYQQYAGRAFPIQALLREDFIRREEGSGTRLETEQFLRAHGVDPARLRVAVEVRSTDSVQKMVSEGMGVAILSRSACEDLCQVRKLLVFDFDVGTMERRLYILRHKSGTLSPIAQTFFDYARGFYPQAEKE